MKWPWSKTITNDGNEPFVATLPGANVSSGAGHIEEQSETWRFIKNWAELELQRVRGKNDANITDIETAILRGRIRQIKDLMDLSDKKKGILQNDK